MLVKILLLGSLASGPLTYLHEWSSAIRMTADYIRKSSAPFSFVTASAALLREESVIKLDMMGDDLGWNNARSYCPVSELAFSLMP